jgi:hypothetical protein
MPTKLKLFKKAYYLDNFIIRPAKIFIKNNEELHIIPSKKVAFRIAGLRGALSTKEIEILSSITTPEEIIIKREDIVEFERYPLKRERKDIKQLFDDEDRGNVFQITLKTTRGDIKLLILQRDVMKIKYFLQSKRRK